MKIAKEMQLALNIMNMDKDSMFNILCGNIGSVISDSVIKRYFDISYITYHNNGEITGEIWYDWRIIYLSRKMGEEDWTVVKAV